MTDRELGLRLAEEVIAYFDSMPVLTEDEEYLRESAERTKDELKKKGK